MVEGPCRVPLMIADPLPHQVRPGSGPEAAEDVAAGAGDAVVADPRQQDDGGAVAVFPSLRDEDLERLGVSGPNNRNTSSGTGSGSLSDKDIESKFTALSLAFKTDKMTLGQRLQRQQRQRDLAENNMAAEFTRLLDIHKRLSRAASDAERGDFLERFRLQLEALDLASRQVSSAAEMYGAVQQEDRLSHAMEVIDLYVESLKRLHQKLCQELDEKKRVLSENNIVLEELQDLTEEPPPRTTRYRSLSALATNISAGTKRRASIAAMQRPLSTSVSTESPLTRISSGNPPATGQEAVRSGRWSAPSRVRRISLAMDQQPPELLQQTAADRRESRVDSCMSEIAEMSESRRESAAEQADEELESGRSACDTCLGQNGMSSSGQREDEADHPHMNGNCRGAPEAPLTHLALLEDSWRRGREVSAELWSTVSRDSFRWLRLWLVCALLTAALAILVTTLLQSNPHRRGR